MCERLRGTQLFFWWVCAARASKSRERIFLEKWGASVARVPTDLKKGFMTAAHTHTPFLGQCPPPTQYMMQSSKMSWNLQILLFEIIAKQKGKIPLFSIFYNHSIPCISLSVVIIIFTILFMGTIVQIFSWGVRFIEGNILIFHGMKRFVPLHEWDEKTFIVLF